MGLSRMSAQCRQCPFVDTCNHKKMEALGYLPDPYIASATEPVLADLTAPLAVKHDYRDIKVSENVTVTIDLEDLKRELVKSHFPGFLNGASV